MNKGYWRFRFRGWFKLTKETEIMFYRNPSDCSTFFCENTNPTHKGLIWGKRKDKTKNWIKVCRLTFSNCLMFFIDSFRNSVVLTIEYFNKVDIPIFIAYVFFALCFYHLLFYFSNGAGVISFLSK